MRERLSQGKVLWISLYKPTTEEIKKTMKELDISPLLMEDLSTPVPKNYAREVDGAIKLVLDFPVIKNISVTHPHEVKLIIMKQTLLTVHYDEMGGMDRFKRQMEVAQTLRKNQKNLTGADLCLTLLSHLYDSTGLKLDYLETKLEDIESEIFNNNEKEMVEDISKTSKKLISFKHILCGHEEIFTEIHPAFKKLYKENIDHSMHKIMKHYTLLKKHTELLTETLLTLRDTNAAMLNTKQNEVMKIFTIMAFITFPLTLISSVFGMNTVSMPIVGHPLDFWIITGVMLMAMTGFFIFFKYKKWI